MLYDCFRTPSTSLLVADYTSSDSNITVLTPPGSTPLLFNSGVPSHLTPPFHAHTLQNNARHSTSQTESANEMMKNLHQDLHSIENASTIPQKEPYEKHVEKQSNIPKASLSKWSLFMDDDQVSSSSDDECFIDGHTDLGKRLNTRTIDGMPTKKLYPSVPHLYQTPREEVGKCRNVLPALPHIFSTTGDLDDLLNDI